MIVVLLFVTVLASDYARRKKGLDYEEQEKLLKNKVVEEMEEEEHRRRMDPSLDRIYWGDPWGDKPPWCNG